MNKRGQEEEEDSVFHLILEALDEFLGSKSSDFITLVELKQLVYAKASFKPVRSQKKLIVSVKS